MTWPEVVTPIVGGLSAGLPVGWAALRQLGRLFALATRVTVALERIADRLDGAEYVKLSRPPGPRLAE